VNDDRKEGKMKKEMIYELLDHSEKLPALPPEIQEIMYMLQYPDELDVNRLVVKVSELKELNEIILKSLNLGYFQNGKRIESIKEAIIRLGLKSVQNLIIFFITRQLFPEGDSSKRSFDMQKYWKHVLGTAVAASFLSERLQKGDKYKLFTYGLIHDIGIPVMDVCMPEQLDEVGVKLKAGVHQLVAERSVFDGISHAEIGGWLCRRWNIREDIINIIEYHHTPLLLREYNEDCLLMHTADVMSSEYYERLLGININHRISDKIMDMLGLSMQDYKDISQKLPEEVDRINYFLTL
jgi:HD-like signal output (HDOD) protein